MKKQPWLCRKKTRIRRVSAAAAHGCCPLAAVQVLDGASGRLCFYRRDVPGHGCMTQRSAEDNKVRLIRYIIRSPLKIVWPRVFVLLIRTERANIAGRVVY